MALVQFSVGGSLVGSDYKQSTEGQEKTYPDGRFKERFLEGRVRVLRFLPGSGWGGAARAEDLRTVRPVQCCRSAAQCPGGLEPRVVVTHCGPLSISSHHLHSAQLVVHLWLRLVEYRIREPLNNKY